jgi:putative ABC transport system ATP-binding protein
MDRALIVCDNLVKIYKVANLEVVALQGLDLAVSRGELLGIVGASGSGKTSLMNILGGLDRPSAGRVWVDRYDLLKMSDAALDRYRRAVVGFVWQQGARNLVPYLNAFENVMLPMTLAGVTGRKKRHRADELLRSVGLAERRHHYLQQMSGGEQQRVAIAVALANAPSLLLADEPTGEVDSATAIAIYQALRELTQRYGVTTIIVSHDPGIAYHVDRVVAIRDGRTSSETVRQATAETQADDEAVLAGPAEHHYEELVVVDSAGRLQVPKEYLHRLNIKGRVRLELREDEIAIRPTQQAPEAAEAQTLASELAMAPGRRGSANWWERLRRRGSGGERPS